MINPNLEVLVATMGQKNCLKWDEMGLDSDVFFANQDDEVRYEQMENNNYKIRMFTTPERGVGKNRNKALLYSEGDILLFADDDMCYAEGYRTGVLQAFAELPQADVIIFSCTLSRNGKIYEKIQNRTKRCSLFNSLKFGTYLIAVRKEKIIASNIWFSNCFGGGAIYGSGEDSLFLVDCFKKGLKIYTHSYLIGNTAKDESSWFHGFNEKYFYDKGAWLSAAFPILKYPLTYFMALRLYKRTDFSVFHCIKLMLAGIRGFDNLVPFKEFD